MVGDLKSDFEFTDILKIEDDIWRGELRRRAK